MSAELLKHLFEQKVAQGGTLVGGRRVKHPKSAARAASSAHAAKSNPWILHIKAVSQAMPHLTGKELFQAASASYHKGQAAEPAMEGAGRKKKAGGRKKKGGALIGGTMIGGFPVGGRKKKGGAATATQKALVRALLGM